MECRLFATVRPSAAARARCSAGPRGDLDMRLKVLVILGSVREGRMSERVAAFVMSRLALVENVDAELVDLRKLNLPIMEERLGRIEPTPPPVAELGAKIVATDAIIIVTPEYNRGY